MNEENGRMMIHSTRLKRARSADCIRAGEGTNTLEEMKKHKATDLSGVVTELLQPTGEIGVDSAKCNYVIQLTSQPNYVVAL